MHKPLNVAIAGFGWWGKHIARRLQQNDRFTLAAIAEPDLQRQIEISAIGTTPVFTIDQLLDDKTIDAVILATPNTQHEQQVVQVAAAGRHVFCEKPLGLNKTSAQRSVNACKVAGVVLGIGHERRFEPALQKVKRLIDDSTLGTIMHAEAAFSHDKLIHVMPGDWRTMKDTAPAAGMTGMGIHLTDLYLSMFGRVETVQAMTAQRLLEWETGDVVTVQLKFAAGMTASFSALLYTPHFIRVHVFGSDAWVEVRNNTHPDTPGGIAELILARSGQPMQNEQFDWTDTVMENLNAFADAIAGLATYPYTSEQLIHNIEVLEAIATSATDKNTVHIPQ